MKKHSAIVTGAAKRIGRSMAIGLAQRGFDIGLHYQQSQSEAINTKEEIEKLGRQCVLLKCDLTNKNEMLGLLTIAAENLSNIELLINNASIFEGVDFLHTDMDLFERNMALHVQAPFFLSIQFAKICKQGNIINIIDTMITKTNTEYFAYLLSKKALFELNKLSAKALAPGIRVNAIAPGSTTQPVDAPGDDYMEKRAKQVPLKMAGNPEYILHGIDYFLNNPFVTGECLFIDGGAHIEF